jgi:dipeptide/tripeptide permease
VIVKSDPAHSREPHEHLLEEVKTRQRNTLWPDAMVNSSRVDALLWKGSAKATRVQRIAIVIFGMGFFSIGVCFLFMASEQHSILEAAVSMILLIIGTRVAWNAFKHEPRPDDERPS